MSHREITQQSNQSPTPLIIAVAALAVGIFVGVMITRWSAQDRDGAKQLAELRDRGVIRIGFANEAPFAFLNAEGQLTGEAPEVARVIFKKMGVERVEGVLTDFGSLIPDLNAQRFDVIAAGMYITPGREKEVAFSLPTYQTGPGLLVRAGNPKKLHSFQDFRNHPDAVIAFTRGAVEEEAARAAGIPASRMYAVPDIDTGVNAVRNGRADGFAITRITAKYLAQRFDMKTLESAEPFFDLNREKEWAVHLGGFGFRLEDQALKQEFNRHLAEFLGSPEHLALVAKFGFDAAALPPAQNQQNVAGGRE